MSNNDANHCVSHMFGSGIIIVFFMMKVAQGEHGYPCPFIMTNTIDKEKGQGKTVPELSRNSVHHLSCMENGKEPVTAWHLFVGEIRPGHVDHSLPMILHQTVGRLLLSRSHDNFRIVVNEIFRNSSTKQLSIAIQGKASGKSTSSSTKRGRAPRMYSELRDFKPNIQL
jgi:hypothetical protein